MFLEVGIRDCLGLGERRAHPIAEPVLHAEIENQRRKKRDDDSRRQSHQAEHDHEPDMEPRSRRPAAPFQPDLDHAPDHQNAQGQQQKEIEIKQANHEVRRPRHVTRWMGKGDIGRHARERRTNRESHGELAREAHAGSPTRKRADCPGSGLGWVFRHTNIKPRHTRPARVRARAGRLTRSFYAPNHLDVQLT